MNNQPNPTRPLESPSRRLWTSCAWLALALMLTALPTAYYGYSHSGRRGLLAAALAGSVVLLGSMGALIASALIRGPQAAMLRLGSGMALRMGLPLAVGMWLDSLAQLSGTNVFGMLLVFYLVALAVETPLSLRFVAPAPRPAKSTGPIVKSV
ncbi:MAG: hypothetical protein K8T25_00790 [Planctomycetia bacterium]|nr:hypothetical protein [Planctomycetia bacterium]